MSHNFDQCKQKRDFEFKPFILMSTSAASQATTRSKSTKDIESSRRRTNAQDSQVGSFVAVENPHKNLSNFWLAKVVKPGFRHEGKTEYSEENHITLTHGRYYTTIHVYKPKSIKGEIVFQWDPEPRGARFPSAWTVDAEAVLCTDVAVTSHQMGMKRQTRHKAVADAYDLKYLSKKEFDRINSNFIGTLAEL
jgi:hypothetical protein